MDEKVVNLILTIVGSAASLFLANLIGKWFGRQLSAANIHLIGAKTKSATAATSETDAKTAEVFSNISRKQVESYYQYFVTPLQIEVKTQKDEMTQLRIDILLIRDALKVVLTNLSPGNPTLMMEMAKIINDLDRLGN